MTLAPWSLFAAMIAAAGLPIYIHAPKFFVDNYGVSLAALGGVLALLRLLDVVQDPFFGWLAEVTRARRAQGVSVAVVVLAGAMIALFAVPPPIAPLAWFALTLTVLFSAYSYLTIVFYAQGVEKASQMGPSGHTKLAGWRETGSLIGVSFAAVAPVALAAMSPAPFAAFAFGFAALCLLAWVSMRRAWGNVAAKVIGLALFRPVLADPLARRLLFLALINAAPVAVTSTLFLFFVESRLELPDFAGGYLLLFFLAAAASAPLWSKLGTAQGEKRVLIMGMILSILSFVWAFNLGAGQALAFALICLGSGAALGADMVLLPAIFARRLSYLGNEAAGFGLWSFASKLSLALAAAVVLPALQWAGFQSGATNQAAALSALTWAYAGLPCGLKVLALAYLTALPLQETTQP
jgi:glycoside/pentoside/hexuronide:cation symporter, GPH family